MKNLETQLIIQLSAYGLKPQDWQLKKLKSSIYKIQSRKEPSFVFIGKYINNNGVFDWKKIQLLSL